MIVKGRCIFDKNHKCIDGISYDLSKSLMGVIYILNKIKKKQQQQQQNSAMDLWLAKTLSIPYFRLAILSPVLLVK